MVDEISVMDYATPIHRVLLESNEILGIGVVPALLILMLDIILMSMVSFWCFPVGIVLYIVCRLLCRKDPQMLTIIIERLMQPSLWRAL